MFPPQTPRHSTARAMLLCETTARQIHACKPWHAPASVASARDTHTNTKKDAGTLEERAYVQSDHRYMHTGHEDREEHTYIHTYIHIYLYIHTPGPGMQLLVSRQPAISTLERGQPGYSLSGQPVVVLQDAGGNTIQQEGTSVSASLFYQGVAASDVPIPVFEQSMLLYNPGQTSQALIRQDLVRPQAVSRYVG